MVPPGEAAHRHRAVLDAPGVWAPAVRAPATRPRWLARTCLGDVDPGRSSGLSPATREPAAAGVHAAPPPGTGAAPSVSCR